MQLRPYQRDTIDKVQNAWGRGTLNVLATLATGAGKTNIFLALIDEILHKQSDARFVVLAHRAELITQPVERLRQFFPHRADMVGVVMAGQNECAAQIVVGTVQTLQSERRLAQLVGAGPVDYLIIDECHHSSSSGYLAVLEGLRGVNPNLCHLGVTATPKRADKDGLPYDEEVVHYGVKELVRDGWLAPPRWLAIQTGINLGNIPVQGSGDNRDFNQKALVNVFETDNCFDLVAQSHHKYAAGRKALAFTVSVEGAYRLADALTAAGIIAKAADGTTPKEERAQLLADFRAGQFDVLVNCALFTEGLDVPEVSCIHQVRPTKSDALYLQMVGRALRIVPGKNDALILDYAPADARDVTMLDVALGVNARRESYMKNTTEEGVVIEGEVITGFTFDGDFKWNTGDPMEIVSRQLDYLNLSVWKWNKPEGNNGRMVLGLGRGEDGVDRSLVMGKPGQTMDLWLVAKKEDERNHKAYLVKSGTFEECSRWSEDYADKRGNLSMAKKQAKWHKETPTEAQEKYARRLGVFMPNMNRGDCAAAITAKLAIDAVKRERTL